MPTKQALKDTFDRWYSKSLIHLAKQEWEEARLCLNSAVRALADITSKAPQGESKTVQQDWLFDLAAELEHLEKKTEIEKVKEKLTEKRDGKEEKKPFEIGVPDITFDDVVGLEDVKRSVFLKAIYPRLYPELYAKYKMKVGGGLLLYGLPGTGKTMIAQAIAHETKGKFFAVRCSDIGSKWFGETEQNIRAIFEEARSYENAVLFFDELEAYAGKRRDDSAMSRVVPEFLTQLQGVLDDESKNKLLVIAATNRPWDIDGAFLRPGRFDDKIFVPQPRKESRIEIIRKKMEGVPTKGDIDYEKIGESTNGYNGADVAYVCDKAKETALRRVIEKLEEDEGVTMDDFDAALVAVKSSVNADDEKRMRRWDGSQNNPD